MESLESTVSPTASRPMLGMTILVVEDSLFASEAMRLLCLRSGARIRRADCLRSARRHLNVYRPSALIVDMGLPDGSGVELIQEMARVVPKVTVVAAMSGDPGTEAAAMDSGADCFLCKPLTSISAFQREILSHMPREYRLTGPRVISADEITPDPIAYHDDLQHAAEILKSDPDGETLAYLGQFLSGIARCAGDGVLEKAASQLDISGNDMPAKGLVSDLAGILDQRMAARLAI